MNTIEPNKLTIESPASSAVPAELATVNGLAKAFAECGLLDASIVSAPPKRALTVLRRGLRELPYFVAEVLTELGLVADAALTAAQRSALAAVCIDLTATPSHGEAVRWAVGFEAHVAAALGVDADDDRAVTARYRLLDARFGYLIDQTHAFDEDDDDESADALDELIATWYLLIDEGFAQGTSRAAFFVSLYSTSLAKRPDVTGAYLAALSAARWAAAPGFTVSERLSHRAAAVIAANYADRDEEAIALATQWALLEECDAEFGDDERTVTLKLAIAQAHRALGDTTAAINLVRAALLAAECALGRDHRLTVCALTMLCSILYFADHDDEALVVARYTEALLWEQRVLRPAEAAHAAVDLAMRLQANGEHDAARAVAERAFGPAASRLGQHHHDVQALRSCIW